MDWIEIKDQNDIEALLERYGGFHDSCIVGLSHKSGAYVNKDMAMGFGRAHDHELTVTFERQFRPVELELCFTGMRRLHLVGWQDNYCSVITDCHLAFHRNVLPGEPAEVIVWADTDSFDPQEIPQIDNLSEPATTYIVANCLKWRIMDR